MLLPSPAPAALVSLASMTVTVVQRLQSTGIPFFCGFPPSEKHMLEFMKNYFEKVDFDVSAGFLRHD